MATLTLADDQIVELVLQLPVERRRSLLMRLTAQTAQRREEHMHNAEQQLRRLYAERGGNWDTLPEDEREAFIDDLVHEDRT